MQSITSKELELLVETTNLNLVCEENFAGIPITVIKHDKEVEILQPRYSPLAKKYKGLLTQLLWLNIPNGSIIDCQICQLELLGKTKSVLVIEDVKRVGNVKLLNKYELLDRIAVMEEFFKDIVFKETNTFKYWFSLALPVQYTLNVALAMHLELLKEKKQGIVLKNLYSKNNKKICVKD